MLRSGPKGLKAQPPEKSEILLFRDYLLKSGINVTLRKPRGEDIEAACGQLRLHYEKE
jgi:23S rRNA (adenine2503-C2)-methyltransferase